MKEPHKDVRKRPKKDCDMIRECWEWVKLKKEQNEKKRHQPPHHPRGLPESGETARPMLGGHSSKAAV